MASLARRNSNKEEGERRGGVWGRGVTRKVGRERSMQNVLGGRTAESASNNKNIDPLKGGELIPGPVCVGPLRLRHPGLMGNHSRGGFGVHRHPSNVHLLHVGPPLLQSRRTITEGPVRKLHALWRSRSNNAAHGITCLIGRRLRCAGHRRGA